MKALDTGRKKYQCLEFFFDFFKGFFISMVNIIGSVYIILYKTYQHIVLEIEWVLYVPNCGGRLYGSNASFRCCALFFDKKYS
jgi:hypothetical protein